MKTKPSLLIICTAIAAALALTWVVRADDMASAAQDNLEGREVQAVDVFRDGDKLHRVLSMPLEKGGEATGVYYQQAPLPGRSWTGPVRVDIGLPAPFPVGRGRDHRVAAQGERILVVYMIEGSGFGGRGPLVSVLSEDGGRSWRSLGNPSDSGTDGDHSFTALTTGPDGRFHLIWLDTRRGEGKDLYTSSLDPATLRWSRNVRAAHKTCTCCPNQFKTDAAGRLYALYRKAEPRDLYLVESGDGGQNWSNPQPIDHFGWDFQGCPHVGGALVLEASSPDSAAPRIHALTWTGKSDTAGVFYVRREPGQSDFSPPRAMGRSSARNPALAQSGETLQAAWTEIVGKAYSIVTSRSQDGGRTWTAPQPVSPGQANQTHPILTALPEGFLLHWTESSGSEPTQLRQVSVPLD